MNWDVLGAVAELLGAIAVLATLFYLARQITLNTQATKSASIDSIQDKFREQLMAVAENDYLAEIMVKNREGAELTTVERNRLAHYYAASLRHLETAYLQHRADLIDSDLFNSYEIRAWVLTSSDEFSRDYWRHNKNRFSSSFRNHIDTLEEPSGVFDYLERDGT